MESNRRNNPNNGNRDLCIRDLTPQTTEQELTDLFKRFGVVDSIRSLETNPTFAFVRYSTKEEAELAIKSLRSNDLGIKVDFARERRPNKENNNNRLGQSSNGVDRPSGSRVVNNESQRCIICDEIGHFECSRCSETYCTEKCQKFDWYYRQHRRHCFEMPALVPLKQLKLGSPQEANSSFNTSMPRLSSMQTPQTPTCGYNRSPGNNREQLFSRRQGEAQLESSYNQKNHKPKSLNESQVSNEFRRPDAFPLKNNSKVTITSAYFEGIRNKLVVFVRPIDEDHNRDYGQIIKDVNAYASSSKPLENEPGSEYVAAPYEEYYYRAAVIHIYKDRHNEKLAEVGFLDFGNVSTIPFKDLRQLSRQLQSRNRYANKILLKSVPVNIDNNDVVNYLKKFDDDSTPLNLRFQGRYEYLETPIILNVDETQECVNNRIMQIIGDPALKINASNENEQIN